VKKKLDAAHVAIILANPPPIEELTAPLLVAHHLMVKMHGESHGLVPRYLALLADPAEPALTSAMVLYAFAAHQELRRLEDEVVELRDRLEGEVKL